MARLIDADVLEFEQDENCIANGVLIWGSRSGGKTMTTVLSTLKKMVDNAPTVDAVEVVRCKDCTFCVFNSSNETFKCRSMNGMYRTVVPDDFCSYGERKDND